MDHRDAARLFPFLIVLSACSGPSAVVDAGTDAGATSPADAGPAASSCAADASAFPAPTTGRCTPTATAEASLPPGDDGAGGWIQPGGRRLSLVGQNIDVQGFPMAILRVPDTPFVIVTDGTEREENLQVVDTSSATVVDSEAFAGGDRALFLGLAISSDHRKVWASGGGANTVWAFDFDDTTGQLTAAPDRDLPLAVSGHGYVSGIALLPDDHTLLVNLMLDGATLVVDADTNTVVRTVTFDMERWPYDLVTTADGTRAYVSMWGSSDVVPFDTATGTTLPPITVGKAPEGMALSPDGSVLAVTSSDADSVAVVDVATAEVQVLPIHAGSDLHGASPSAIAFGPDGGLYVASAGDNAIDVFASAAESWAHRGRIPTRWYPTAVAVDPDGAVLIATGKGLGSGPALTDVGGVSLMHGNVAVVDAADITDTQLGSWEMDVASNDTRPTRLNDVSCPDGASYDFPIPQPDAGPSTQIEHVVLIIRENKTYDAYMGALTDASGAALGNGDPSMELFEQPDQILPNTFGLARRFTSGDNYYTSAEASIQGHIWTTHGRTTDFTERTWLTTWGRGYWTIPPQGITPPGDALEGSIFDHLHALDIEVDNYGEVVGALASGGPDHRYPGVIFTLDVKDIDRARWLQSHWLSTCQLPPFTYILLPNDHTYGLSAGKPTPESMIADNDEGLGLVVDALSHTSFWPSTVIFVIEDDPADGADHVDKHRSPLLVISPWARRGHVTHVHYNESSVYRTIQLILGIPPLNALWETAAPMYDAFSSTPDYTPYSYTPRRWPEETNVDNTNMATISAQWDFSRPDDQPGLSRMLWRYFHHGAQPPWPVDLDLDEDDD